MEKIGCEFGMNLLMDGKRLTDIWLTYCETWIAHGVRVNLVCVIFLTFYFRRQRKLFWLTLRGLVWKLNLKALNRLAFFLFDESTIRFDVFEPSFQLQTSQNRYDWCIHAASTLRFSYKNEDLVLSEMRNVCYAFHKDNNCFNWCVGMMR